MKLLMLSFLSLLNYMTVVSTLQIVAKLSKPKNINSSLVNLSYI